jgi:hypothetical protein
MQITSSSVSQAAASVAEGSPMQDVQINVLKKAMNAQASAAAALIQALPQSTGALPLATKGHLGTQLNTRA